MKYRDLREFLARLEERGDLQKVSAPVSVRLDMTAFSDFVLRAGGPALLFTNPDGYKIPVLTNLFGTPQRVALAMGAESTGALGEIGELLASLKELKPSRVAEALEEFCRELICDGSLPGMVPIPPSPSAG